MRANNLAARAGRWSAAHRKAAILGWIVFVIVATLIGGSVGQTPSSGLTGLPQSS